MTSFLITFKPDTESVRGWPMADLQRLVKQVEKNGSVTEDWRFKGRNLARRGDRVFLLRQGRAGPAIIGYGRVAGAPSTTGQSSIPIRFDRLIDTEVGVLVTTEELRAITTARQVWGTMSSGVSLSPEISSALERLVAGEFEPNESVDDAAEEAISKRTDIPATEKQQLVKARRGQGIYRTNLEKLENSCRVTGVTVMAHLRASHSKPWRDSADAEKLPRD